MPKLKVLVVFSNPPDQPGLRLDREDKLISQLARRFPEQVEVERLHAADVDDIHHWITGRHYDVIQFSGHGSPEGIYLDKNDVARGELVSARRLLRLLELAGRAPRLVVLMCCYSAEALEVVAAAAPFVITSASEVTDHECSTFVTGLYERLFDGASIETSHEHAQRLLQATGLRHECFRLSRRSLIERKDGVFVLSLPDLEHDSILVNLDAVRDRLDSYGMSREVLLHNLARKITIHRWIFHQPRDRAVLPVGNQLFGEFTWTNAADVVTCNRLMRFRSDVPSEKWKVWVRLLTTYNDLASADYRSTADPSSPLHVRMLTNAVTLFGNCLLQTIGPLRPAIERFSDRAAIPHLELLMASVESAQQSLELERYRQVVRHLEEALTNYHELVDLLQPEEAAVAG